MHTQLLLLVWEMHPDSKDTLFMIYHPILVSVCVWDAVDDDPLYDCKDQLQELISNSTVQRKERNHDLLYIMLECWMYVYADPNFCITNGRELADINVIFLVFRLMRCRHKKSIRDHIHMENKPFVKGYNFTHDSNWTQNVWSLYFQTSDWD